MAAVDLLVRDPIGAEYAQGEQDLQDRILSIYGSRENDDNLFRPDLADHQKVGFFGLDRPSQTDVTEIVDLKEMTEVLQILLQDVATLKRDINFAKHVMQADYESKLQQKSLELYCRINERVTDLEKMHEERVGTVRRAFRQQLSDAIARVAVLYNKNLQRKVRQEKSKHEGEEDRLEERFKELQMTIQRNESIIHMLKMQIAQLQKEPSIADSPSIASSERPSAVSPQTPSSVGKPLSFESPQTTTVASTRPPAVQVSIKPTFDEEPKVRTPSVNHEAEALKGELETINKKLEYAQESLKNKQTQNEQLDGEVKKLNEQLTAEMMEKEQLKAEIQNIQGSMAEDKAAAQRLEEEMSAGMERQKAEMERIMEERLKQAKLASSQAADAEAKAKQQAERDKMQHLFEQEKLLKEQLAREFEDKLEEERAKIQDLMKGDTDINKLRRHEQMLRDEVARLKREIEKIHKTWEKKFAILQQSLHALKDESYIRQQLQRQAANLHHAAVSYSVDTPMGIHPTSKRTSPTKRPLPDIPRYPGKPANQMPGGAGEKDFISYTVSAPSGRGTALFSTDENQIMGESDRDDIPADVMPLPDRPNRRTTPVVNFSEPVEVESTSHRGKGHVIVVPHIPVS